jgi:hypothetical protein
MDVIVMKDNDDGDGGDDDGDGLGSKKGHKQRGTKTQGNAT